MTFILITEIHEASHTLLMSTYLSSLPQVMQDKSKKYIRWQDQQAYVLGKLLVRKGFEMFNSNMDPLLYINGAYYKRLCREEVAEEEEETVQTQTKAQKLAEKMWGK